MEAIGSSLTFEPPSRFQTIPTQFSYPVTTNFWNQFYPSFSRHTLAQDLTTYFDSLYDQPNYNSPHRNRKNSHHLYPYTQSYHQNFHSNYHPLEPDPIIKYLLEIEPGTMIVHTSESKMTFPSMVARLI